LRNHWTLVGTEVFELKKDITVRSAIGMDNRTNPRDVERDNAMDQAVNDQLLGRLAILEL